MELTARLYLCARCRCQVVICSQCDRGQRYCGTSCAAASRRESQRAAGRRYQNSRRGRHRHAARQRRYRQRQREKVTHQGSPAHGDDGSLSASSKRKPEQSVDKPPVTLGRAVCHVCARLCSVFLRLGFIRRRDTRRSRPTNR